MMDSKIPDREHFKALRKKVAALEAAQSEYGCMTANEISHLLQVTASLVNVCELISWRLDALACGGNGSSVESGAVSGRKGKEVA